MSSLSGAGTLPLLRRPAAGSQSTPSVPPSSSSPTANGATTTTATRMTTTGSSATVAKAPPVCSKCGTAFSKATAKFCAKCGTKKAHSSSSGSSKNAPRAAPSKTSPETRSEAYTDRNGAGMAATPPAVSHTGASGRRGSATGRQDGSALDSPHAQQRRSSASGTIPFLEKNAAAASTKHSGRLRIRKRHSATSDPDLHGTIAAAISANNHNNGNGEGGGGGVKAATVSPPGAGLAAAAAAGGKRQGSVVPLNAAATTRSATAQGESGGSGSTLSTPHHHRDATAMPEGGSGSNAAQPQRGFSTATATGALLHPVNSANTGDAKAGGRQNYNHNHNHNRSGNDTGDSEREPHSGRTRASATTSTAHPSSSPTTIDTMGSFGTIEVSPEEEAQYTAWATLGPEGLTPDMLQTSNASTELKCWRKGSLIGRGTYGSVFLGLLKDGSFYAVKCVELGTKHVADMAFNIKELVSLSREINMMQRLRHRNLCSFKGVLFDAEATSICMFMEYVGGGSLTSIVKRFKPLPAPVVRRWTRQLLTGLLYLHSQHIIHRDIKGDNVLIDTNASPDSEAQVKLVDFGAARRLTDAVSQSRTVIGTPYWMAPEVVDMAGEGKGYSYKADVWSVGCTVAEMLTGRPPWPARENAPAAIIMVATASGMPTEVPQAEATAGCYDFMVKCFERDPDKRPTVEELLQHPWILGEME